MHTTVLIDNPITWVRVHARRTEMMMRIRVGKRVGWCLEAAEAEVFEFARKDGS